MESSDRHDGSVGSITDLLARTLAADQPAKELLDNYEAFIRQLVPEPALKDMANALREVDPNDRRNEARHSLVRVDNTIEAWLKRFELETLVPTMLLDQQAAAEVKLAWREELGYMGPLLVRAIQSRSGNVDVTSEDILRQASLYRQVEVRQPWAGRGDWSQEDYELAGHAGRCARDQAVDELIETSLLMLRALKSGRFSAESLLILEEQLSADDIFQGGDPSLGYVRELQIRAQSSVQDDLIPIFGPLIQRCTPPEDAADLVREIGTLKTILDSVQSQHADDQATDLRTRRRVASLQAMLPTLAMNDDEAAAIDSWLPTIRPILQSIETQSFKFAGNLQDSLRPR